MLQELIFAVNVADVAVRFIFEVLLKPHQINYVNEFSLVTIT